MQNSPELNGKYLGTITKDFLVVTETLKEASYQLRVRKISQYPIFPISKQNVSVGQLLISKEEVATQWNFNFSYLEDFVQREIVGADKVEDFQRAYKDPEEFCCFFVVDQEFTKFVFVPYPID